MKAKDLKKQRWAAVVAAVLAVGMILSLLGAFIGSLFGAAGDPAPQPQLQPEEVVQQEPEDFLLRYETEIERLEAYIEEYEATPAVLLELAENYHYLIAVRQMFFDDPAADLDDQRKLASIYEELIELEPENPYYRLELVYLYSQLEEQELVAAEVEYLYFYFAEAVEEGTADSLDRYYFAVLLGEFLGEREAAEEQLLIILEEEGEDEPVFQEAQAYLQYLENSDIAPVDPE